MKIAGMEVNMSFLNSTECLTLSNALLMSITQVNTSEPLFMKCEIVSDIQIEDHLSEDDDHTVVS